MLALYTLIFVTIFFSYVYFYRRAKDPYGTFHISFNKLPGGPDPPRTEWLNMGFWKDTEIFPEACQALALRLFRAASLKPDGRVLDVGHGSGDSILLQLSHPQVTKPALLCGITSLPSHHRRSQERVDKFLSSADSADAPYKPTVFLFEGDAIWRSENRDHPLSPHFRHQFDSILALDCAYHFNTREEFLRQSFRRLATGGNITLADLCFAVPPGPILKLFLWRVLHVMPKENMVTKEQYLQQVREIGYEDIEMEDVSSFVFPGFRNFLKQRGNIGRVFASLICWLQGKGLRFIIIKGTKVVGNNL
ncbi:S-adenosyl-L-methionine-dependent methyltransferase [Multifurca ochricompacta]|uniref:S-adenosyl-L-methionine-dependent methyltransferase n=1 Tax=Multifurca ochricompacta TaxID=376703 RepID=A0AAD4QRM4_9AGAM|nr:S-adenosyl-L-methionine-dependent methyltransferase [Multifurca ochricompacta]